MHTTIPTALLPTVRALQRAELTEAEIYAHLARQAKPEANRKILARIAEDERRHHAFWQRLTQTAERPSRLHVWVYLLLARTLGLTFALKLMERGEDLAQHEYERLREIQGVESIVTDEEAHEQALIGMLHDEPLEYAGSIVLGLNDALVELTGALAGLTFALANGRLVAVAGLVTGIAAALSMAASEYLSSKSELPEGATRTPLKAALYTGVAYIVAVAVLITPFFVLANIYLALASTLALAVLIVAVFTFYISVAKSVKFLPRFAEMSALSLSVAAITFAIGWTLRAVLGIEV